MTTNGLRIPVMWGSGSGDVGRRRSEATLVVFYISQAAHMSQEKGKCRHQLASFRFLACQVARLWIPLDVGQHYGDVGRCLGDAGQPGLPHWFRHQVLA